MATPEKIKDLVRRFGQNIDQYKSTLYNETETRIEFINPFWRELGWDVDNKAGYALNYRDVIHEDSIRLRGTGNTNSKSPDYSFRIGGERKFFLEAKKPSVAIKSDSSPAYQLRCYGWSCGLPLSVLSDFEEFVVYNCRIRPNIKDNASVARIIYWTYVDYVDHWDEIAEVFHRESILRGSFDRFVESRKSRSGTSEVDKEFLAEIEEWRNILAKEIIKSNPNLDVRELNFAVQRTIDRILFLRMAEDRGMEPEDRLFELTKSPGIYSQLIRFFEQADNKYNSGFFHFTKEAGQAEPEDQLTLKLSIADGPLKTILERLYPPKSPYRFDVFPVEILGNVYERFLGKVIRLTSKKLVKVEEKPEVRKAGGVYYTPSHIVDYIVKNTVGRFCEGKTPKEISALKILDPACGSGSFLLGAYKFLLDWHLNRYVEEFDKTGKIPQSPPSEGKRKKKSDPNAVCEGPGGWRLTLAERKRILLNNIFGVDLDAQAVEVTKLSLSLAVLEGVFSERLDSDRRLFDDRALPNLSQNIRCGNSLIAPDFWQNERSSLLDDSEEELRINAFDWRDQNHGFGDIMAAGGFDIVIGNPPWGQKACKFTNDEKTYFSKHYPASCVGILDLFRLFIEQSIQLLNHSGFWGQVLPAIVLFKSYESTRRFILDHIALQNIDHWGMAFQKVTMEACTLIGKKDKISEKIQIRIHKSETDKTVGQLSQKVFFDLPGCRFNLFLTDQSWPLLQKLMKNNPFSDLFEVHEGIHSGNIRNKLFVASKLNDKCKKLILGRDEVQRYALKWNGQWVHYSKSIIKRSSGEYAGLGRPEYFDHPKLIIRRTGDYVLCCLDEKGYYFSNNVFVCLPRQKTMNLKFYMAILNSRLMTWYYQTVQPRLDKTFAEIKINTIGDFPAPDIDFSKPSEVKTHDEIAQYAEQLLELNKQINQTKKDHGRELLERRISSLNAKIDGLVYDLYGLTDEERKLCSEGQ